MKRDRTNNTWTRFDNPLLNRWRDYGGSPLSVLHNLRDLKHATQATGIGASYGELGLINYNHLVKHLSYKDVNIILLIEADYNWPLLQN